MRRAPAPVLAAPVLAALVLAALVLTALSLAPAPARAQAPAAPPAAVAPPAAPAPPPAPRLKLDARPLPLLGALRAPQAWAAWRGRFVTEAGRVVDTANGGVSHSEGQGYGMLLAVAANDRPTFERIWSWTRANLMVRDDALMAWRWEPERRPAIADMNNASDGELLVAWALAEAAQGWNELAHAVAARRIAVEVTRRTVVAKSALGPLLLPAVQGFAAEQRADGPVVNPSYWVFPAFPRLALVAPEVDWAGLAQSGLDVLKAARLNAAGLPPEWVSLKDGAPRAAAGLPAGYGYNAVRVPLHLAWAGIGEDEHHAPFARWAARARTGPLTGTDAAGRPGEAFGEAGYAAVAALALCVVEGAPFPADLRNPRGTDNYYPATLHLMALIAAQQRYPQCLR